MHKVGVVGCGIVGQATAYLFDSQVIHDPPKGYHNLAALTDCPVIFMCLPTPFIAGRNDLGVFYSALEDLIPQLQPDQVVAIRSTILPGTVRNLQQRYKVAHFASNPEFLRAHRAFRDALDPYRVVIGADTKWAQERLLEVYKTKLGTNVNFVVTDSITAEVIKCASNCYLAMKISYANEIYDVCLKLDVDYNHVGTGLALDPRIGDGDELMVRAEARGFDDECLPKDLTAFTGFVQKLGCPATLLKATAEVNGRVRTRRREVYIH